MDGIAMDEIYQLNRQIAEHNGRVNMSEKKTGGAAFPTVVRKKCTDGISRLVRMEGMTLRDYFAAKALTSCISHWDEYHKAPELCDPDGTGFMGRWTEDSTMHCIAEDAYAMADAMLKARGV